MGVSAADTLSQELIGGGRDADTAVAIIERVCSADQRVFLTTLEDLPQTIERSNVKPPALIVVSRVVATCRQFAFEELVSDLAEQQ